MSSLFHRSAYLSIAAATIMASVMASAAPAPTSPYFGRWTVSDDKPAYTPRGRLYKSIDIVPCGKDFCGVSLGDNGECGPTLFRFMAKHASGQRDLHGHGKWGTGVKNLQISTNQSDAEPSNRYMELFLGDGHNFGGRSDNMPKFEANYRWTGAAQCKAA